MSKKTIYILICKTMKIKLVTFSSFNKILVNNSPTVMGNVDSINMEV